MRGVQGADDEIGGLLPCSSAISESVERSLIPEAVDYVVEYRDEMLARSECANESALVLLMRLAEKGCIGVE